MEEAWDSSNPKFNEAWNEKNRELINWTYEEIGKQWAERAAGATIADVFILCQDLYERVNEIEWKLDQPNITKQEVSDLSHSLLHTWSDIFKIMEKNTYPQAKSKGGLYIYREPEHLEMNDWIEADGISFNQVQKFLHGHSSLQEVLSEEEDGLKFYNVFIMNDGSVSKKIRNKKKPSKPKAQTKPNSIQSSRTITADGEMQIPVLRPEDLFDTPPVSMSDRDEEAELESVGEIDFIVGDDEDKSSEDSSKSEDLFDDFNVVLD